MFFYRWELHAGDIKVDKVNKDINRLDSCTESRIVEDSAGDRVFD
jgi:hypothetical protein